MTALDAVLAQPGVQTLGWTLLHFIWQGALAACALAGINAFIPRRSANARYVAACATLVLMLGVTIATFTTYRSGNGRTLAGWANATQALVTLPTSEATASRTPAAGGSEAIEPAVSPFEMIAPSTALAAPVAPPVPAPDLWISTHFGFLVPWLAGLWFVGVLALSLRLLGGWIVAQRLKRGVVSAAVTALEPTLERLRARLKVSLPVRLYQSARVEVPTVIGCLKPVILLPASAIIGLSAMQLEALLAHELAHIRRHDYLVNLLQTVVETLLFYHPAVWWVSHRIRAEREHCCDDVAVEVCGNALVYARALAELEQARVAPPQLAVAANGGCLLERILRLVKGTPAEMARTSQWIVGAIAMATMLIVIAGARLTPPSAASMLNDAQIAIAEPDAPMTAEKDEAACDPSDMKECDQACQEACDAEKAEEKAMELAPEGAMSAHDAAMIAPEAAMAAQAAAQDLMACNDKDKNPNPNPNPNPEADPNPDPNVDPIFDANPDPNPDLGDVDLSSIEDQEVRKAVAKALSDRAKQKSAKLRMYDGYSKLLRASGLGSSAMMQPMQPMQPIKVRSVIKPAERIQNRSVIRAQLRQIERQTQRYQRDQTAEPAQEELIKSYAEKLAEHGITEDYIRAIAALQQQVTMEELIKLNEHGVSVEYLAKLEELGYDDLTADQVVRLVENGVTPEYAAGMKFLGRDKFSVDDLIKLRENGISADYIGQLNVLGFRDEPISHVIKLREHGVGPGYIAELRALGYKLTIAELIVLKEHGITARYVAELRGLGYTNLTVPQIVKLHEQGVTSGYISDLEGSGLRELTTDELILLRSNGVTAKLVMDARLAGLTVANLKVQKLIELSQKRLWLLNVQN